MKNKSKLLMFGAVLLAITLQGCTIEKLTKQKNDQLNALIKDSKVINNNFKKVVDNYSKEMDIIRQFATVASEREHVRSELRSEAAKKLLNSLGGTNDIYKKWAICLKDKNDISLLTAENYLKKYHQENEKIFGKTNLTTENLIKNATYINGINQGEQLERLKHKKNITDNLRDIAKSVMWCLGFLSILIFLLKLRSFKNLCAKWTK